MAERILIKSARLLDPASGVNKLCDILIQQGKIQAIGQIELSSAEIIDARGLWVLPGLIDMHVHLREPGDEKSETIQSGLRAALQGGFTHVVAMANTSPPVDNITTLLYIKRKAIDANSARLSQVGAITKGMQGRELTNFKELADSGAVAFSEDGKSLKSSKLMKNALEFARDLGKLIISHCEDEELTKGASINEGPISQKLGVKGMPKLAEELILARDILLAKSSRARIHIAHLSTKGSLSLVKWAKEDGVDLTCEVTPHHLTLTENQLEGADPLYKVNPPLRSIEDVEALIEGISLGIIDVIASDHAPHSWQAKLKPLEEAPFGVIGLETTLAIVLTELVHKRGFDPLKIIALMSVNPARILGLEGGKVSPGKDAEIVLIDPVAEWTINSKDFLSRSRNTPFEGKRVKGKVKKVILRERIFSVD